MKKSFYLLKKRKIYERLDFYPFLIIKLILFAILLFLKMKKFLYYIIAYGVIYLLQIILYFLNHVFIEIGIKIGYFYVNNIDNATHVKILICSNTNDINNRIIISKIVYECNLIKIEIDKMIYIYNKDSKQFYRSKYELIKQSKLSDY